MQKDKIGGVQSVMLTHYDRHQRVGQKCLIQSDVITCCTLCSLRTGAHVRRRAGHCESSTVLACEIRALEKPADQRAKISRQHGMGLTRLCLWGAQRAMGEFGAVSVISGNIIGKTQTLTLYVESAYKEYNTEAAFSASVLLSFLALGTLFIKDILERKTSE